MLVFQSPTRAGLYKKLSLFMKKLDGLALLVCINSSGLTFIALCLYDVISILDGLHKWT